MADLRKLKQQFLTQLENERGRSRKTVENYNRYLERFIACTDGAKPATITAEHITAFCTYLSNQSGTAVGVSSQPMKQRTQNYHLTALRMFVTYIASIGITTVTPNQIKLTRVPTAPTEPLTAAEQDRLLAAPDQTTLEGKRDVALLALLLSTKLRVADVCALTTKDIKLVDGSMSICRDTAGIYWVSVSSQASCFIRQYLRARADSEPMLFVRYGRKANDGGAKRLHPKLVQRLVRTYAAKAGITRTVTPQLLRSTPTFVDEQKTT